MVYITNKKYYPRYGLTTNNYDIDPPTPEQFYGSQNRRSSQPEERLMLAILEDAIICFHKHFWSTNSAGRGIFRDAKKWIFNDNEGWLYSFENVCNTLDIEPDYVRSRLKKWREEELTRLPGEKKAKRRKSYRLVARGRNLTIGPKKKEVAV